MFLNKNYGPAPKKPILRYKMSVSSSELSDVMLSNYNDYPTTDQDCIDYEFYDTNGRVFSDEKCKQLLELAKHQRD